MNAYDIHIITFDCHHFHLKESHQSAGCRETLSCNPSDVVSVGHSFKNLQSAYETLEDTGA